MIIIIIIIIIIINWKMCGSRHIHKTVLNKIGQSFKESLKEGKLVKNLCRSWRMLSTSTSSLDG